MQPSFELVVCIASTALFDCSESHEIWQRDGIEAYKRHQCENINVAVKPGVGFPLVQSLLELNKVVNKPLIDVVLVSRNDAESAQRIIQSINYHQLSITRMSFTCGMDVTKYLPAWKCDLFLSTGKKQVENVLAGATPDLFKGIAAGLVYHTIPETIPVQSNSM
jgi:5'-nucleotidase